MSDEYKILEKIKVKIINYLLGIETCTIYQSIVLTNWYLTIKFN